MLSRIPRPPLRRSLQTAAVLSNKTVIPSIILDQLKDTSSLAAPTASIRTKKQIFLRPEEFRDRRFNRYVEDIERSSKDLRKEPFSIATSDLYPSTPTTNSSSSSATIESFKPTGNTLSQIKYDQLKLELVDAFKHSQLSKYLNDMYSEPAYSKFKKSNRGNKRVLAERIISKIWGVQPSGELSMEDLLVTKRIKLNQIQLFLLLSENGYIIKYLQRSGIKLSFNIRDDQIEFQGTSNQVTNAEIILSSILNNTHKEKIDLSIIKQFYLKKFGEFSLADLGRNTEVFFNRLDEDNYELITLNNNQIKRSKRLLLWLLNYNEHSKSHLVLPDSTEDLSFIPYQDDESLSWNNRNQNLFLLKNSNQQGNISNKTFMNDLHRFSDKALSRERLSYESEVEQAKTLPQEREESVLEDESWKLLGELGILGDEKPKDEMVLESKKSETESISENIDDIYSKITDFTYRDRLNGLPDSRLNNPIFTVTLGNILYQGESSSELVPKSPSKDLLSENMDFKFNSNVPLVNDAVLSLPLYEYPELSIKEVNHFLNKDPHSYVIQLKFLPSPYIEAKEQGEIHNQMKYPPVEIWVDLNDRSKPDIDTMNIVTVEGENNCYVSLPNSKSDMKITCQLSGNLLEESVEEENQHVETSLSDILNSTPSRYSRFKSQPGINTFLHNAKLDFSGKVPTSIPSHIDFNINGEVVRYHYINVTYRRQMNFSWNDRLVQFNIVEGGSLGGRKLEVNFVGDLESIEKDELEALVKDVKGFIAELK
ncbi:uncharacterized protein CANTADRAFT_7016 [Suhomyces tanzawaensis NRRL Y-17324]|uniref:Uncharacterized protein n=1 Tax=Suhomyces tanzawaensis NRRL Y-17324 TaxID=984487 RepID=A0A1E4SGS1_9ASCO|nr:uncharacterized protein CANTADRAFT_7016 [Suhomyces tanzawaensis NRRL Y-17324]ODV78665.1 hypothetical protein CANTADRAFT_7016 [Suhomyces tanzawaensis NRRL Y-17324]